MDGGAAVTRVVAALDEHGRVDAVRRAVAALRRGGLVVLPGGGAYALVADAFDDAAVRRLRHVKQRPVGAGVPVAVGRVGAVAGVAAGLTASARLLLQVCWPGPLSVVVHPQPTLLWAVGDATTPLTLSMPLHPMTLAVLAEVGPCAFVAAGSVAEPARTVHDALDLLDGAVDVAVDAGVAAGLARPSRGSAAVDGGLARGGVAPAGGANAAIAAPVRSTVVDLRPLAQEQPARLVREGAVPTRRLLDVLGAAMLDVSEVTPTVVVEPAASAAGSPGRQEVMMSVAAGSAASDSAELGGAGGGSTFWGPDFGQLVATDPEIAEVVLDELDRLRRGLQLIASENFTSPAVLAALGSTLSNKYAEGYPHRRYYGGCAEVDRAEDIGVQRALALFGAEHANLQPHSGASANLAAFGAFLSPGDTYLAMSLPHGGHLTHGAKVSFSGKWFTPVHYGVHPDTEDIDYDQVRDLAREHRPKLVIAGGSAIPRLIDFAAFRAIADEVGAIFMVDAAHFIGLVAGQAIPSPVPYADVVTFTTHKVLRGPRGGMIVCKAEHAKAIDKAVFPMMQGGPLMHAVTAKAVALREASTPQYQAYARQVIANARALTDGLVAEGMRAVTGGTDTHLALIDLQSVGVTGAQAEARCDAAGIVLNKNAIPFDPQPPSVASGIRVGTPAVTTQGMGVDDMGTIAALIGKAVRDGDDDAVRREVAGAVDELVTAYPAYPRDPQH
jgi:glycine hydroxymethyltransferase